MPSFSRTALKLRSRPMLWIENTLMVEMLPPEFAARYLDFAGRMAQADSPLAMMASHERSVRAWRGGPSFPWTERVRMYEVTG